jgi:hypothetical protein
VHRFAKKLGTGRNPVKPGRYTLRATITFPDTTTSTITTTIRVT